MFHTECLIHRMTLFHLESFQDKRPRRDDGRGAGKTAAFNQTGIPFGPKGGKHCDKVITTGNFGAGLRPRGHPYLMCL